MYYDFLLDSVPQKDVYFPFLSMTREFSRTLIKNTRKRIFSSVRGTDFTVTPYINPKVVQQYALYKDKIYKVHFLSHELEQIAKSLELGFQNTKIIYQGVDLALFERTENPLNDKIRLLTVGRLHYIKGLEFAILAAAELHKLGVIFEFNIIGHGPEWEKLTYLIHDLGLEKSVFLRGAKDRYEILRYFKQSNIYIHTHVVSGVSNTMLEALAIGLEVIVFDSNLHTYQDVNFAAAIKEVPRYDYRALANKILDIWGKDNFAEYDEHKLEILNKFSLSNHLKGFLDFFEWTNEG